MRKLIIIIFVVLQLLLLGAFLAHSEPVTGAVSALQIEQGGTGTTTVPSYGQLLVGTASGKYDLMSTSTLGITGDMTALPHGYIYVGNASNVATATSSLTILDTGMLVFGTASTTGNISIPSPTLDAHAVNLGYLLDAIEEVVYTPTSFTAVASDGVTGDVTYVQGLNDGLIMQIEELGSTPGYDVIFDFTNVESFSRIWIHYHYDGNHTPEFEIWDYTNSEWDTFAMMGEEDDLTFIDLPSSDTDYIDGSGNARIRAYHSQNGAEAHFLELDYVALAKAGLGSANDHGALTGLLDDDHTQYLRTDGSRTLTGAWNLGGYALSNGGLITATGFTATGTTASIFPNASTTYTSATRFFGDLTGTASGNLVSGGTLTTNYHCRFDGTGIDCDRVEDASGACGANAVCMGGHTHVGVNEVYGSGWNGDTDTPEKDDVYDYAHLFDTDDDGKVNVVDTTYGYLLSSLTGVVTATSSPTVDYVTATSTTATSSLPWLTSARLAITEIFQVLGNLIVCQSTTCTYTGTQDMSGATVKQHTYPSFTYASSTAFVGTTTVALAPAQNAQQWNTAKCFTDDSFTDVYITDGTNRMNWFKASTTVGTITFTTNNTFTAGEKRYIEIGNATSTKSLSCSFDITINN